MKYDSIFRPDLFHGQCIIVTGGGSGIGRCTAHELAALGAHVVIVGRSVERLNNTVREIVEDGGSASAFAGDIRDEEQVARCVQETLEKYGRIDGLVNNAGGQYPTPIQSMKTRGWESVIKSNLTGGFLFSREVFNQWMEGNGGAIVNIVADIQGGWAYCAHSGAARAGMISFTETAAFEWAPHGVRVNAVAPGFIFSSGIDTYTPEEQEYFMKWQWTVPAQRFGTVSETAAVIVFLLSPAAAYVTGSVYRVDGGAPNARKHHELARHEKSVPYNGFHRSVHKGKPES